LMTFIRLQSQLGQLATENQDEDQNITMNTMQLMSSVPMAITLKLYFTEVVKLSEEIFCRNPVASTFFQTRPLVGSPIHKPETALTVFPEEIEKAQPTAF